MGCVWGDEMLKFCSLNMKTVNTPSVFEPQVHSMQVLLVVKTQARLPEVLLWLYLLTIMKDPKQVT